MSSTLPPIQNSTREKAAMGWKGDKRRMESLCRIGMKASAEGQIGEGTGRNRERATPRIGPQIEPY